MNVSVAGVAILSSAMTIQRAGVPTSPAATISQQRIASAQALPLNEE